MTDPTNPLRTRVGHAEWGDNRFRGYSVAEDLAGQESFIGLLALGISGRRLNQEECGMLDDLGVVMTVADPRIWPLKLTRIVSSYGGCLAALAAGQLALEEAFVGHYTTGQAAQMLVRARQALGQRALELDCVVKHCEQLLAAGSRLIGVGVPFRPVDERVTMLTERVRARGRDLLPYWQFLQVFSRALELVKNLKPNIGLGAAAVCLDLGLSAAQSAILVSFLGQSDFLANAVEGAAQRAAPLQQLGSEHIRYVGPPERVSPRKLRDP
jgi:hypothetical protein